MNNVIIQARTGSTRLPNKVLLPFGKSTSVLEFLIRRVRRSKFINNIIIATTHETQDKPIVQIAKDLQCDYFCGDEQNVLGRVKQAANFNLTDIVIDITADCPFVDPLHIDELIKIKKKTGCHYVSNCFPRSWPDGFDIQVYDAQVLYHVEKLVTDPKHRSHVGWNITNYPNFVKETFFAPTKYNIPNMGLTLDTQDDHRLLNFLAEELGINVTAEEIIDFVLDNKDILKINQHVKRKTPGDG